MFYLWSLSEADEVEWITLEEKMKESIRQSQWSITSLYHPYDPFQLIFSIFQKENINIDCNLNLECSMDIIYWM